MVYWKIWLNTYITIIKSSERGVTTYETIVMIVEEQALVSLGQIDGKPYMMKVVRTV